MVNRSHPVQRYRGEATRPRRPFWLPASNYYVLAVAVSAGTFFLVWGVLQDGHDEAPWIAAGMIASGTLIGAVLMREVILRTARNRFLENQRRLDRSLHGIIPAVPRDNPDKLTLERNSFIIQEIRRKSEAAKVLGKLPDAHREVFEMCTEYIAAAERELPLVGVGSPRIAALRKGREQAAGYQHFHLLKWAEIEARALTQEAQGHARLSERLEALRKALGVVKFALGVYPDDHSLIESDAVLSEALQTTRVSHLIEKAERSEQKGNHSRALFHYKAAISILNDTEIRSEDERGRITAKIDGEVERINHLLKEASANGKK